MRKNSLSFLSVICLVICFVASNVFAVDRIWHMRYTYGPDARPAPKIAGGLGIQSNFGSTILFPLNVEAQIAKEWDIGAKLDLWTFNQFDNVDAALDVGARYRLGNASFVEVDGYIGLNRSERSAIVVTYGKEHYIAKNFSNYYEGRVGVLNGAAGDGGWAKLAVGTIPTLRFGSAFLFMIEINASTTVGHVIRDFMTDIIPKAEISVGGTRIRLEFDIGLLKENNNNQKNITLYILQAF